jgi:hypothetical protein
MFSKKTIDIFADEDEGQFEVESFAPVDRNRNRKKEPQVKLD